MGLAHSPRIVTDGLVMYIDAGNVKSYPGTGTSAFDLSVNDYTHTLDNAPFTTVDNVACFDVTTNGRSIYTTLPNTYTFTTEYTLISWARMISDATAITWRTLWRTSATHPLLIQDATNDIGGFYGAFRTYGLNATTLGLENKWTMFTVVGSGGSSTCYINDGSTVGTTIAYTENGNTHRTLGTWQTTGTQPFGYVGTGSIYSRALSTTEIRQNFNALRGRFGI